MRPDDGCLVQPKHVATLGRFSLIFLYASFIKCINITLEHFVPVLMFQKIPLLTESVKVWSFVFKLKVIIGQSYLKDQLVHNYFKTSHTH